MRWPAHCCAAGCDELKDDFVRVGVKKFHRLAPRTFEWADAGTSTQAQCIATDDPRLAK